MKNRETLLLQELLSPAYLVPLGLRRPPFAPHGEGISPYLSISLSQRLDLLQHLLCDTDLLILLTGVEGIGKTTFLQAFLQRQTDYWRICQIDGQRVFNPNTFLDELVKSFAARVDDISRQDFPERLQEHWSNLRDNTIIPMLVIDDAHQLTIPVLELIISLAMGDAEKGSLLRVLLCGKPEIERIIKIIIKRKIARHKPLTPLLYHNFELLPFSYEETLAYIGHRLATAGFSQATLPLSAEPLQKIHQLSRGRPATINLFTHDALLRLVGHQTTSGLLPAPMQESVPDIEPELPHLAPAATVTPVIPTQPKQSWRLPKWGISAIVWGSAILAIITIFLSPLELWTPEKENIASTQRETAVKSDAIQHTTAPPENTTTANDHGQQGTVTSPPSPPKGSLPKELVNRDPTSIPPEIKDKNLQQVERDKPAGMEAEVQITPQDKTVIESKLLAENPKAQTIQLIRTKDMGQVKRLMAGQAQGGEKLISFKGTANQKTSYVVVYGIFPTRQTAELALRNLPQAYMGYGPWIRSMSSVHDEIKRARKAE